MYGYEYRYASKKSHTQTASGYDFDDLDDSSSDDIPKPLDPFAKQKQTKPYVPATTVAENSKRPFGGTIDAPLN